MKLLPIILVVLTALVSTHTIAQNLPATAVADALDDLKEAALEKIDAEVEINARAFADAKDIQSSLSWGDWFRPVLDIAIGVYDAMTAIPVKNPNTVRTWLGTTIQGAGAAKKVISILGSFDRLKQDGATLALTIEGPPYNWLVSAMLDRADATSVNSFSWDEYRQSVMNDLFGAVPANSPIRVSHKSTSLDRSGGDIFDSVLSARFYAESQLTALSAELRQSQLPPDRITTMVAFIRARRQDVLQSRVGATRVTYQACLTNGTTNVWRPVSYSLGTITQLEHWRISVLDLFVQSAGFDSIGILSRVVETVGSFVLDHSLDAATETVNLNLSVEATIRGQVSANKVLKDATSLGLAVAKPDIGMLADEAQSYVSNSREQINMIPQQMMDALPGEISKLLLLIDDTANYTHVLASATQGPTIAQQPQDQMAPLGQTASFSVVATGAGSLTYQWRRNGVDIPGGTGGSYTTSPVSAANNGYTYQVVVSDSQGSTLSRVATLQVVDSTAPCDDLNEPNDSSLTAISLATGVDLNGLICTPTDVDWFRVDVAAPGVLTFDLSVPAANDYDLELYGPDAAYITGSYGVTGSGERITHNAIVTGTYYVRIYAYPVGNGSHNPTAPYTLTAGFASGPITILASPTDRTVPAGASASFRVTAAGAPPLTHQWQRSNDGGSTFIDVAGATASTYATPPLTLADSGAQFRVRVSNAFGSALSDPATLTVNTGNAITWTGTAGDGDWFNRTNWNPMTVPMATDVVNVTGGISVPSGAEFSLMNLSGSLSGNFTLNGTLSWTNGQLNNCAMTIAPGGVLNIGGTAEKQMWFTAITNAGTVIWSGTGPVFAYTLQGSASVFENQAGGVFDAQADGEWFTYGWTFGYPLGSFTFNNAGVLRKTAGNGASSFYVGSFGGPVTFNNSGTVESRSGTLNWNTEFNQTAGDTRLAGGSVGGGKLNFTGGTLSGSGTINASVVNGAVVSPGSSPGTLTINGDYTQTVAGVLQMELGGLTPGSGFDQLVVNGQATLAGALNVTLLNGFAPAFSDAFPVLTYASRNGSLASLNLPSLPNALAFTAQYGPGSLTLLTANTTGNQQTNTLSAGSSGPGAFELRFTGEPDRVYRLQASTNFVDWYDLATNTSPYGLLRFLDPEAGEMDLRFYRTLSP